MPTRSTYVLLTASVLVCCVGAVDAAIGDRWDLVAVFALTGALQLPVLLAPRGHRVDVSVRGDLAHWASNRSQLTGEPVEDIVDRSLASYKQGLYGADG